LIIYFSVACCESGRFGRFRWPRWPANGRRRLNILTKAERRRRIFARLREGWAYDEIAREERVSPERIRQIVSEVLAKRVIDRGADHAHL
jgi:DNA-directed RNA polymerase sigma subunit (sigma70/sigma32)